MTEETSAALGRGPGRRDHQHLGQQRADELAGVVDLGELDPGGPARSGDVVLQGRRRRRVAVLGVQGQRAGHRAAGLADQGRHLLDGLRGDVLVGDDQQDAAAGEGAVDQRGRDGVARRRRTVSSWVCSCCVRSSSERLSCSSAVTWFLMSARIGSFSAVVPMTIPSATARKTAISETR